MSETATTIKKHDPATGDSKKKVLLGKSFSAKKGCRYCICNEPNADVDYKDIELLQSYMTEHGKIIPRRVTGSCAFFQRRLTRAIKRARALAMIGFVSRGAEN